MAKQLAPPSKIISLPHAGALHLRLLPAQPRAHTRPQRLFHKLINRNSQRERYSDSQRHRQDRRHLIADERDEPPSPMLMNQIQRIRQRTERRQPLPTQTRQPRSEERRVGKDGRALRSADAETKRIDTTEAATESMRKE